MFTDKDGNVYGAIGDTCFCDGLFQNNPEGENDNTGSIISLNVPRDIYAIGIRNTYGLDFDPETGILWDTENGPESFDEVNLVEKKFNSGWNRIQGPIKPDQEIPIITDFIYSDPEFSWERPIGVTGIHFVESSKFPQYSNSVLVGSFHDGILYHFKLNENRDGFKFDDETLQDLVLNKEDNPNEIILATGFLGITDIKQGPDGLIYIVSIGDGKIFRISPSVNTILDDSKCKDLSGKDLSGCDFSGKDLSGKDLRFVDFSNSLFYDVNFQNSDIVSADFSNSKFFDVNFSNTNLDSAIFRDVEIENTNFKESSLVATKFFNSKLRNNDFKNSNLERTLFSNLELYRVNFENVRFYDSDFENLTSKFVNFENTDMTFAEIKNSRLEDSKFDNSRLWKTYFIDSNLQNSSFVNSDNYSSVFKNTDLKNTDFQFSRFSNVDFSNTNFENASLLDIYPIDSAFNNVEFNNTEINTCLNHDVFSRIFNKILRSIDNLGLEIFENLIIDICNN